MADGGIIDASMDAGADSGLGGSDPDLEYRPPNWSADGAHNRGACRRDGLRGDRTIVQPTPTTSPYFQGACMPGEGISTHYWFGSWEGPLVTRWSAPGRDFHVNWDNRSVGGHQEFDISHARDRWTGADAGFGSVRVRDLPSALPMTQDSHFERAPGPLHKLHVNVIIEVRQFDADASPRSDITISEWHHEGRYPASFRLMGTLDYEGSRYEFYKRSGDLGEVASYNIRRTHNRTRGRVDVRVFLDWLMRWEENSGERTLDDSWFVSKLGWEVTGQSGGVDGDGVRLVNSSAHYWFDCYSIPKLRGDCTGDGCTSCL